MADILHDLPIGAEIERVFRAVSTPEGLDTWWTQRSVGCPEEGTEYELGFGPECVWRARVTRCVPNSEFDLELTHSDDDWLGTHVSIRLESRRSGTWVSFAHIGKNTIGSRRVAGPSISGFCDDPSSTVSRSPMRSGSARSGQRKELSLNISVRASARPSSDGDGRGWTITTSHPTGGSHGHDSPHPVRNRGH